MDQQSLLCVICCYVNKVYAINTYIRECNFSYQFLVKMAKSMHVHHSAVIDNKKAVYKYILKHYHKIHIFHNLLFKTFQDKYLHRTCFLINIHLKDIWYLLLLMLILDKTNIIRKYLGREEEKTIYSRLPFSKSVWRCWMSYSVLKFIKS